MRRPSSIFLAKKTLWASAFLTVLLSASPSPASTAGAEPGGEKAIAAKVNGQPIYLEQVNRQADAELQKMHRRRGPASDEDKKHLQQKCLAQLIDAELINQQVRTIAIPDLEEKVSARIAELGKSHRGQKKSEAEIRALAREELQTREYLALKGLADPEVPEEEIKALYENGKGNFRRDEAVHVRHILVQTPEGTPPKERKKAEKKIQAARRLLLKGEPFEKIAKEFSEDNAAPGGGDIGFITRGYMPAEFEAMAFSLEPGKVSEIVETKFGYHLLEVLERTAPGSLSYEEMRDFLRKYLQERIRTQKYEDLVKSLRAKAQIDILLN